jgi:probable HAF family extracellular repeat protein
MRLRPATILCCLLAAASARAARPAYTVTDLGPDESWPNGTFALNNKGEIVGTSNGRAWVRSPDGKKAHIDPLPGFNGTMAMAISDNGAVAGQLGVPLMMSDVRQPPRHAFLYRNGKVTDLGVLPGERAPGRMAPRSWAAGVNDAGDVVGTTDSAEGRIRPFLWRNGTMRDLGGFGGAALAVNAAGDVVGVTFSKEGPKSEQRPFLWHDGKMTILPTLGTGFAHAATAINAAGTTVGHSTTTDGTMHACQWRNGKVTDLGALRSDFASGANSINASGAIIGETTLSPAKDTYGSPTHAVLWTRDHIADLNDLLAVGSGWELTRAIAINDRGDMLCRGRENGQYRAVLLQPVHPKPEAPARGAAYGHP